ncbi:uncharacterized protein SEPMUDRAFT_113994 [Sphaerulina musiva SO2202]|uniref:Helicase ATP-binding domain-containing protein n=1 Tax=Sphaerulina musiva (strain SO2202) TaxID=692275 RepID=M3CM49_SPHMS|nr:uncharacterized protein SEPMUDRAFT_113994 [Sphaerulina musiva SO2202]EMF14858.1 hypothetical protein SEPMUDRAFT_113994 [Sphaerulina musiva SO2202]
MPSNEPQVEPDLAVRLKRTRVHKDDDSATLLAAARRLTGIADFKWRSVQQLAALRTILGGAEEIVVVMPTGAGKSLLFMLPASLYTAGTTVVILPLISLRADIVYRLRSLKLDHSVWAPRSRQRAPVVLVSIEAASTRDFIEYAQGLVADGQLDRVVIDEAHLTIAALEYRPVMNAASELRRLRTQFLYLTGMLPPSIEADFRRHNCLAIPTILRIDCNCPQVVYTIERCPEPADELYS